MDGDTLQIDVKCYSIRKNQYYTMSLNGEQQSESLGSSHLLLRGKFSLHGGDSQGVFPVR